jgi:preprotein translocase subunit SecG
MCTLLHVIHILVCLFLVLVVLLQQGRGGGLGGAFGGGATQVFGGRGAGNFMTRLTAACATVFILTSLALAWLSSSGDRELKKYQQQQQQQQQD